MIKEVKLMVNGEPRKVAVKPGTVLAELSSAMGSAKTRG